MAKGQFDKVKGYAKEAAGRLLDDEDLKRSGRVDYASGEIKEKMAEAVDSGERSAATASDELVDRAKEKVLAREKAWKDDTKG